MNILLATAAFSIPAGPFAEQLLVYADQAQVSVLYEFDGVNELQTHAVEGELKPRDAIEIMVSGLGYKIIFAEPDSVTLQKITSNLQPVTIRRIDPKPEPLAAEVIISTRKVRARTRTVPSPPGCVPLQWVAGMVLNRLGQVAMRMGYMSGEVYCYAEAPREVTEVEEE